MATGTTVAACVVIWLAFSFAVFSIGPYSELSRRSGGALLEETFGYSAADVHTRLDQLGGDGRASYWQFQVLDSASAILMAIALTLALRFSLTRLTREGSMLRALGVLPILAAAGEIAENTVLLAALQVYPGDSALVPFAGTITRMKFVLGIGSMVLVALSFGALAARWATRQFAN